MSQEHQEHRKQATEVAIRMARVSWRSWWELALDLGQGFQMGRQQCFYCDVIPSSYHGFCALESETNALASNTVRA